MRTLLVGLTFFCNCATSAGDYSVRDLQAPKPLAAAPKLLPLPNGIPAFVSVQATWLPTLAPSLIMAQMFDPREHPPDRQFFFDPTMRKNSPVPASTASDFHALEKTVGLLENERPTTPHILDALFINPTGFSTLRTAVQRGSAVLRRVWANLKPHANDAWVRSEWIERKGKACSLIVRSGELKTLLPIVGWSRHGNPIIRVNSFFPGIRFRPTQTDVRSLKIYKGKLTNPTKLTKKMPIFASYDPNASPPNMIIHDGHNRLALAKRLHADVYVEVHSVRPSYAWEKSFGQWNAPIF